MSYCLLEVLAVKEKYFAVYAIRNRSLNALREVCVTSG